MFKTRQLYVLLPILTMWLIVIFHKVLGLTLSYATWYGLPLFITYFGLFFLSLWVGISKATD